MAKPPSKDGFSESAPAYEGPTPDAINASIAADRALRALRNHLMHSGQTFDLSDPAVLALLRRSDDAYQRTLGHEPDRPREPWLGMPDADQVDRIILRRNVRRRAKSMGLSERKLSLNAGLSDSALRHLISPRIKSGRADTLKKVAEAAACSVDDLTGAGLFAGLDADSRAALRAHLARQFLEAEYWRTRAEKAANAMENRAHREVANALDFIDGPYEWLNAEATAHGAAPAPSPSAVYAAGFTAARGVPMAATAAPRGIPASEAHIMDMAAVHSAQDFPIYAAAQGGQQGALTMDWNPIERIKRPTILATVPDAWGMVMVEDSMSPAYEHGDTILVHPRRPLSAGRNAVFVRRAEDGATYILVKRLVSYDDSEWRVRQFNPEQKFVLKRSEWQQCFMIVGKYDRQ